MNDPFSISVVEWLAPAGGNSFERNTNAELLIAVGGQEVTEVKEFESKTVRKTVRVSAGLVAIWLAANWWRLRWEAEPTSAIRSDLSWSMSHQMPAIGGGYVWPDLTFKGADGAFISVVCKRHSVPSIEMFSPIRYLNGFSTTIDALAFEKSVRSFVETVLARLNACGVRKSALHDLWDDILYETSNAKAFDHRKLEALLGLDADEDDELVSSLSAWSKRYGRHALEEIAASSDKFHVRKLLERAHESAKNIKTYAELPNLGQIPDDSAQPPWQWGQRVAYSLRTKWDLGSGPISNEVLADRLNIPLNNMLEVRSAAPFSFGLNGNVEGKLGLVLSRSHDYSRRFDTARLIGDQICYEMPDKLRPATIAMTARQKFQRAFAAEFLCPSESIRERFSDKIDLNRIGEIVDDLSKDYAVSEQVILHHMENRNILPEGVGSASLLVA